MTTPRIPRQWRFVTFTNVSQIWGPIRCFTRNLVYILALGPYAIIMPFH